MRVDWLRALVELDAAARGQGQQDLGLVLGSGRGPPSDRAGASLGASDTRWFASPRLAIVARDWNATHRLAGDHLGLMDAMRLSASTRMVVARARVGESFLRPFAQIGIGQWRTDPALLPLTPRSLELAGQLGAGLELCATSRFHLALETTVTQIYREGPRSAGSLNVMRLGSAMLASSLTF